MIKKLLISMIMLYLYNITVSASTIEHSSSLGFSGLYKENSWTPLIIRISNEGQSISGYLTIETDNSSTATEQIRKYIKQIDLPSGSVKEFSFVLPIGHHSKNIKYYFESESTIIFEETIELKQRGIKNNFILGVSPYPDLGFLNKHKLIDSLTISYPHMDNLPQNNNGYDSVDFISIHREMWDKLKMNQFQAITAWVNKGGILVVWGGKSPSPSKWNYLPSKITGLRRVKPFNSLALFENDISSIESILVNSVITEEKNRLLYENDQDIISFKRSGSGSVFFVTFDYSGNLRNWNGLNQIWDTIFAFSEPENNFQQKMEEDFLLEDYIRIFDNSGFAYLDRRNVALILFLSASTSISMLIFIRFRRKSKNIGLYIGGMILLLFLLSIFIFISIFNSNFRNDSFIISSNIIYHSGESERSILYKDILIGSSNKSESDIIIRDDTQSILRPEKYENLVIDVSQELILKNISLDHWSSKIYRLESSIENLVSINISETDSLKMITIHNNSDFFIKNTFIIFQNKIYHPGNIMSDESVMAYSLGKMNDTKKINEYIFNENNLLNETALHYINLIDRDTHLIIGGFIQEEIHPLEFTNKSWKEKSSNLIIFTQKIKEDSDD